MTDLSSHPEHSETKKQLQSSWRSDAILAKDLRITRGEIRLSDDLNFSLQSGQILYVQGQNGAGKTTLMMMLAGLLPVAQFSSLSWAGAKPCEWPMIYIGHKIGLNSTLSVRQNLVFLQSMNSGSVVDLDTALEAVGLIGYEDVPVAQLSSGQRRRAGLARLWLDPHPDDLWLLDEPFTALDQAMILRLSERLAKHTELGGRVILTSHQALTLPCEVLDLAQYLVSDPDDDESTLSGEDDV